MSPSALAERIQPAPFYEEIPPLITSVLDNDLYKFTMQNAVCQLYPRARVKYAFINRGKTEFPAGFAEALRRQIAFMGNLALSAAEKEWFQKSCGDFISPVYFDFLEGFRFNPNEVKVYQVDGHLSVEIEGLWYRTILWEVPLMALISELYFRLAPDPQMVEDCVLSPGQTQDRAKQKAILLKNADCFFSDFGTRRRYSFNVQRLVVESLIASGGAHFVGTSNCLLAKEFNVKPLGTVAHEWFMYHAAHFGYRVANHEGLDKWASVYQGDLGTALTDTFTSRSFWQSLTKEQAKLWDSFRNDSGDPYEWGDDCIKKLRSIGIDPKSKSGIFTNGLTHHEAIRIRQHFGDRFPVRFGIGTAFTNDVGVKPLNIVIKMSAAMPFGFPDWVPTVKRSDDKGKNSGDPAEVDNLNKTLFLKD